MWERAGGSEDETFFVLFEVWRLLMVLGRVVLGVEGVDGYGLVVGIRLCI